MSQMIQNRFIESSYLQTELQLFPKESKLSNKIKNTSNLNQITLSKVKELSRIVALQPITLNSIIEENLICSEAHRRFFKRQIGSYFSFTIPFQKWLKEHPGRSYAEAIVAWYRIQEAKKQAKAMIERQFEYNAYVRNFFKENPNSSLKEVNQCWNYKKKLIGYNKYEKTDLVALVK